MSKKDIVARIVDRIVEHGGRFLKHDGEKIVSGDDGHWNATPRDTTLLKVAHAIQYRRRRRQKSMTMTAGSETWSPTEKSGNDNESSWSLMANTGDDNEGATETTVMLMLPCSTPAK